MCYTNSRLAGFPIQATPVFIFRVLIVGVWILICLATYMLPTYRLALVKISRLLARSLLIASIVATSTYLRTQKQQINYSKYCVTVTKM